MFSNSFYWVLYVDILLDPSVLTAVLLGFLMACAVGANDVANAMASTVGSKILTVGQAVAIAAVFEASGAFFASGQVTNVIRGGVIDTSSLAACPECLYLA